MRIQLLALPFAILSPLAAAAQDGPVTALDAARIVTDIDPIFADAMAKGEIPGAAFLLVQGTDLILRKAYGYADPAKKIPMDPDRTAIHICSVSKIFTSAAVMQLVEKGTLDLDVDVNRYLKTFQVRNPFKEPLTLRHLLTHTGGLDDVLLGKLAPTPAELEPLGEGLRRSGAGVGTHDLGAQPGHARFDLAPRRDLQRIEPLAVAPVGRTPTRLAHLLDSSPSHLVR